MRLGRLTAPPAKLQIPMAPMISVAFLLLLLSTLNLKLVYPEGNFNTSLPIHGPQKQVQVHSVADIKVGLRSDREGNLIQVTVGAKELGNDELAFERLNREILAIIGRSGNPLTHDIEVEIDADFETQYKYVVKAISKCTGRYDPDSRQLARYVEKIKFAAPHQVVQ